MILFKYLKRWLTLGLTGCFCYSNATAQYVEPELVSWVQIAPLVTNPQIPAGFRLANVDFLTGSPEHASSSMVLDPNGNVVWRYTTQLNLTSNSGSMFDFIRLNDSTLTLFEFSADGGFYLVLDNDYSVRDTVRAIGQFDRTRPHEIQILNNGNFILMGERYEVVEQSLVGVEIKPGVVISENTLIEQIAVQEISPDLELVKEVWLLDHINPQDVWDPSKINNANQIIVLHPNNIAPFIDEEAQKLLFSFRASNQLTVFNWDTEMVEHTIGGRDPSMVFIPQLYTNDSLDLYGQHYGQFGSSWDSETRTMAVRVFNNRYNVQRAEGLLLQVDFDQNTVRKLKSFISNPDLRSTHLGNIDQYGSNWLVNWGRTFEGRENASGYNQFGVKQFNLFLPDSVDSYRITPIDQSEMDALGGLRPVISQIGCTLTTTQPGYWQDGSYGDTFEVVEPGNYFVEIPHGIGLLRSEVKVISDVSNGCGVGVNEIVTSGLTLFPNPTDGYLYLSGSFATGLSYQVIDMTGKVLISKQLVDGHIDITGLPNGVYIFKTSIGCGKVVKL